MKKLFLLSSFFLLPLLAFGYSSEDLQNAQFLANENIITNQSSAKGYRLDDTITRAEAVGIALKIKGVTLPSSYTCKNYFTDVRYNESNNWICRAVEIAADEGLISRSNAKFRPSDTITRAEALAIVMKAGGLNIVPLTDAEEGLDSEFNYDFKYTYFHYGSWQVDVFYTYSVIHGLLPEAQDYNRNCSQPPCNIDLRFNQNATRAEVFGFARTMVDNVPHDTSSWKTYTNNTYKYSIQYPQNYEIFADTNQNTGKLIPTSTKSTKIYITNNSEFFFCCEPVYLSITILDNLVNDFQKYASENIINDENSYRIISKNIGTFSGHPSYHIESELGIDSPGNIILVNYNNKTYLIRYDNEVALPEVNAILTSFQFMP